MDDVVNIRLFRGRHRRWKHVVYLKHLGGAVAGRRQLIPLEIGHPFALQIVEREPFSQPVRYRCPSSKYVCQ